MAIPETGQCRTILQRLQESESCPDFRDLPQEDQKELACLKAKRVGFGALHASLWLDGRDQIAEKPLKAITCTPTIDVAPNSVTLSGPVGVGKTAMLSAGLKYKYYYMAMRTIGEGWKTLYEGLPQCRLINDATFIKSAREDRQDIDNMKGVPLLIWDDWLAGYHDKAGYSLSLMEEVVDYRYRHLLATWFSTNKSASDLKAQPGLERTYSRLADRKWMKFIEFGKSTPDRRRE